MPLAMRIRLLPRSLAARTALGLMLGLTLVQGAGLLIHALDRAQLQHLGQAREVSNGVMTLYRTILLTPDQDRARLLQTMALPAGFTASLDTDPPSGLTMTPAPVARLLRADMSLVAMPAGMRPHRFVMLGGFGQHLIIVGLHMPDDRWLNVRAKVPNLYLWSSPTFFEAYAFMILAGGLLVLWAVWRLSRPVMLLAAAAGRLGRDVHAAPMPLTGPAELVRAAMAFNLMAERIRRFVQDRTFLLSAIGHDLRTPITRLKLRVEFIEDDEMRRRMLIDLDELEAMVTATMAFGRDVASSEPVGAVDLAVLVRTVLDEASDARPEVADQLHYSGPEHLTVQTRSLSMKRAIANLVGNAVAYGGGAKVKLEPPARRDPLAPGTQSVRIVIEDDGPGIPPDELGRVFEPFHRAEHSRNRESGGVGLGLPIARNILRAHGGDVFLANRPQGGAQATVLLPV
jgi:signal transduction histidine kinase